VAVNSLLTVIGGGIARLLPGHAPLACDDDRLCRCRHRSLSAPPARPLRSAEEQGWRHGLGFGGQNAQQSVCKSGNHLCRHARLLFSVTGPCSADACARARVGGGSCVGEWQAWVRNTGEAGQQEEMPGHGLTGMEERARTLSLIDFLADYDARRNPPVYDIRKYDLFLLRGTDLPDVPGVRLTPAVEAWLTVEFLDLPPRPEVPEDLVPMLGESAIISRHFRPEIRRHYDVGSGEPRNDPDPALVRAAEDWITSVWAPFAVRWAQVAAAKTLHRDLFQQRLRTGSRSSWCGASGGFAGSATAS
jgi:hypothetical protein